MFLFFYLAFSKTAYLIFIFMPILQYSLEILLYFKDTTLKFTKEV